MSRGRSPDTRWVRVARINGLHGVRGAVQVYSYLAEPADILGFDEVWLRDAETPRPRRVRSAFRSGPRLILALEGVTDRDAARELLGQDLLLPRSALTEDDLLWADLVGLRVETTAGEHLGEVTGLMETGANDVLVVAGPDRERLIPFLAEFVPTVDTDSGVLRVEWDPDF